LAEAVWKRQFCVITPSQHAWKRLGQLVPRYTRLRGLIDLIKVVSKVTRQMSLAGRLAGFGVQ
jgi:hypothetical protein